MDTPWPLSRSTPCDSAARLRERTAAACAAPPDDDSSADTSTSGTGRVLRCGHSVRAVSASQPPRALTVRKTRMAARRECMDNRPTEKLCE